MTAVFVPSLTAAGVRGRTSTLRRADKEGTAVDARYFEPGSCRKFRPTAGERHLTVFLDAGHGGVGQTESGQKIYEKDETLPVELDALALLRAKGFTVVVSRTDDNTVARPGPDDVSGNLYTPQGVQDDLAARDVCADKAKTDVLVGIYFDAGGSEYDAGSVTGYDTARSFSADNLRLATLVQNDVLAAMNAQGWSIPNEGVVDDTALGGPALTTAEAEYDHLQLLGCLAGPIRAGSPPRAACRARSASHSSSPTPSRAPSQPARPGQRVIASGLAEAIEQYFGPPITKADKRGEGLSEGQFENVDAMALLRVKASRW